MSRRRPPRTSATALTIDAIYRVVKDEIDEGESTSGSGAVRNHDDDGEQEQAFDDDALHQLVNTPRTKTPTDVRGLVRTLSRLTTTTRRCGWTPLVLALLHRRYHLRSPQARREQAAHDNEEDDDDDDAVLAGDGERLVFYVSVLYLFGLSIRRRRRDDDAEEEEGGSDDSALAAAVRVLCEAAPLAGGTRDVCSLLELCLRALLDEVLVAAADDDADTTTRRSSSTLVARALQTVVTAFHQGEGATRVVADMIALVATTLASDLDIVQNHHPNHRRDDGAHDVITKDGGNHNKTKKQEYPSTFHVFLPHHERGKSRNNKRRHSEAGRTPNKGRLSNRAVVQSVAEILIWTQTLPAHEGLQSVYEGLVQHDCTDGGAENNEKAKTCWHRIQTIARKRRQTLNSFARREGYMLADQFVLDATAIRLGQIKRAKAADLQALTRLASKRNDRDILTLVAARFAADPDKTPAAASVTELINGWTPLEPSSSQATTNATNPEAHRLRCQIQRAKVRATLQKLRSIRPKENVSKQVKIACLDSSKLNRAAAVLLRAALSEHLVLDEENTRERGAEASAEASTMITTLSGVMMELDAVAAGRSAVGQDKEQFLPTMSGEDGTATTKAVLNFLERHVPDNTAVLFFTSANLRLPAHEMKRLIDRGSSLHCHDADDVGSRLEREKAKAGDVTISLAWDTEDDLDLHVTMPSGEELFYGHERSECFKGVLDVDMNAGPPYSKEPVENVFLGSMEDMVQAPVGKYKVVIQNYAYHAPKSNRATTIPWRVRVQANGTTTNYEGECVGSGKSSNVTACEFEYQGRTIPFPQEAGDAFETANLTALTSSTGQTLESLRNLMKVTWELQELDRVRQLVETTEEEVGEDQAAEGEGDEQAATEVALPMDVEEAKEPERPTSAKHLEVTSRDRLNMVLCRLPLRFHQMVSRAFGTESLIRMCSIQVARSMLEDDIPVSELEGSGYPAEVVASVKELMKKGAVPAA